MPSVSSNLNPHISAESWRMKTTNRSYFIVNSRRFIVNSIPSSPRSVMITPWFRHLIELQF
jgi:hypothetical protein